MKTKTDLQITLNLSEMVQLVNNILFGIQSDESCSEQIVVCLCEDTDTKTLVIDETKRIHQLSSYQDCVGTYFKID